MAHLFMCVSQKRKGKALRADMENVKFHIGLYGLCYFDQLWYDNHMIGKKIQLIMSSCE